MLSRGQFFAYLLLVAVVGGAAYLFAGGEPLGLLIAVPIVVLFVALGWGLHRLFSRSLERFR